MTQSSATTLLRSGKDAVGNILSRGELTYKHAKARGEGGGHNTGRGPAVETQAFGLYANSSGRQLRSERLAGWVTGNVHPADADMVVTEWMAI